MKILTPINNKEYAIRPRAKPAGKWMPHLCHRMDGFSTFWYGLVEHPHSAGKHSLEYVLLMEDRYEDYYNAADDCWLSSELARRVRDRVEALGDCIITQSIFCEIVRLEALGL